MLSDDEYSDDEELVSNRDSEEGDSESGEEGEEFDAMSESVGNRSHISSATRVVKYNTFIFVIIK